MSSSAPWTTSPWENIVLTNSVDVADPEALVDILSGDQSVTRGDVVTLAHGTVTDLSQNALTVQFTRWFCVDETGADCGVPIIETSPTDLDTQWLAPGTYTVWVQVSAMGRQGSDAITLGAGAIWRWWH